MQQYGLSSTMMALITSFLAASAAPLSPHQVAPAAAAPKRVLLMVTRERKGFYRLFIAV